MPTIIWLLMALGIAFSSVLPPVLTATVASDQLEQIFDGKSLEGWDGNAQFWSVRDGAITGESTKDRPLDGNTFLIFREKVANFELRMKVRIHSGNSGIQFRSINLGNFVVGGYQADIDSGEAFLGDIYEERGRGLLVRCGERVVIYEDGKRVVVGQTNSLREVSNSIRWQDWNDYRVIAQGSEITSEINGQMTAHLVDREEGKARTEGILALQLHAGDPMLVQFKEIRLKRL
jgi:hypothetical protein